jgi:hypothetical protein
MVRADDHPTQSTPGPPSQPRTQLGVFHGMVMYIRKKAYTKEITMNLVRLITVSSQHVDLIPAINTDMNVCFYRQMVV